MSETPELIPPDLPFLHREDLTTELFNFIESHGDQLSLVRVHRSVADSDAGKQLITALIERGCEVVIL